MVSFNVKLLTSLVPKLATLIDMGTVYTVLAAL
jgi:hypothetical protein